MVNSATCGMPGERQAPDIASLIRATLAIELAAFSRAQRSMKRSGMMRWQTRDRYKLGAWDDPGTAAHHFVLRRIRETVCKLVPALIADDDTTMCHATPRYRIGRPGAIAWAAAMMALASMP